MFLCRLCLSGEKDLKSCKIIAPESECLPPFDDSSKRSERCQILCQRMIQFRPKKPSDNTDGLDFEAFSYNVSCRPSLKPISSYNFCYDPYKVRKTHKRCQLF